MKINKNLIIKTLLSFALLAALAILLTWLLEFRYYSGDASAATDFMFGRPRVFLLNAWFLFLVLVTIASLVGSIFRGAGITAAIVLIAGYVNMNKFASRGTPLLPEDLQLASQAAALSKFVSADSIIMLAITIIAVLLMGEILERWVGHFFISTRTAKQGEGSFARRHLVLPRLATIIVAVLLFVPGAHLIMSYRKGRSTYVDYLDSTFVAWNQTTNYNDNGFLLGFIYNWGKYELEEPEGYDESAIAAIKDHYETVAAESTQPSLADADYNIVVILDESLVDTAVIEQYYPHSGGDITPNLHRLMTQYPSGHFFSPDYGGGTANIEFEVLTSLTNYWADTTPYTSLLPHLDTIPSIANFAKSNSYATTAIHSYIAGMYKRDIALSIEGFDQFISNTEFTHTAHEGSSEYINDQSIFAETLDVLNREGKQFVFTITMQNHTPYSSDTYSDYHFILNNAPSGDASRKAQIETYFETISRSDQYLGEFISAIESSEQKTVVILFGDHAPGIFTELNESSDAAEFAASRTTPYFVYANFDIGEISSSSSISIASDDSATPSDTTDSRQLPTTTPNCLVSTAFDVLNLQKSPLLYLVGDLCQNTPILTPLYFGGNEPASTGVLKDYELVTYDILGGKQYWLGASS